MGSGAVKGCNYQILMILAVTLMDVGACSTTSPPPASSNVRGDDDAVAGAGSRRNNGLVRGTGGGGGGGGGDARFFVDSDMIMQLAMRNVENLPKPLQGPAMFVMGFSQQNMKNLVSTVRSLGQMLVSSLVMMAVKRLFFADLKTEADRNKASGLTDAILNMVNLLNF